MTKKKPLIITGPTASGKSALAIEIARLENGVIINADSMQIYKDLPILTAQPLDNDKMKVPHVLYGVLDGDELCSVAKWREMACEQIDLAYAQGLRPILVGGTGLYLTSLMHGLSPVPEIDPKIRDQSRNLCKELGPELFHQKLAEIDPFMAQKLNDRDQQRMIRAYEVMLSTGKSLGQWHSLSSESEGLDCEIKVVMRPRKILHERAAQRFDQMLKAGAIEEVQELLAKNYDPALPVMKALGVKELTHFLKGEWTLEEARERAIISTRQYIKRQSTWFRNQFPDAQVISFE